MHKDRIVYKYDVDGYYIGETLAEESPLEEGIFLLPRNSTFNKPLEVKENGYVNKLNFETKQFEIVAIVDEITVDELTFDLSQLALINKVNVKVNKDIISGFTSTALATEHWYKSTQQDQTNLNQIATANINVKLQISEDNITFIEQEHTAKQIKQVNADCAKHITNTLSKGRELKDLVRLATTKEELIELEKQLATTKEELIELEKQLA